MTINLTISRDVPDLKPRITVVGVGGAGGNAVNNMVRSNLVGCEFIACNTDAQALHLSLADRKIQLGQTVTRGLGAGSRPDVGRQAAEEVLDDIMEQLKGCNMVFVTAGMGGGTGTGAAPVIARAARENGVLTVGVITKPFHFEGTHRMRLAESGIEELQKFVDTLLIIPNQNLFRVANERTTFGEAFKMADDVLYAGVRGVTDLMVMPGLINLDFADIRTVMSEMGKAMMGTGEASGDKRAIDAAEAAISNPLLDDVSMKGAKGVLINITGGADMTLFEVDEAANRIREEVDPEANIIFGSTFDEQLDGKMRISVVATGIDAEISRMAAAEVERLQPAEPRRAVVPGLEPQPVDRKTPDLFPQIRSEPVVVSAMHAKPGLGERVIGPKDSFIAPPPMVPVLARNQSQMEPEPLSTVRATQVREAERPRPAPRSLIHRIIGVGRHGGGTPAPAPRTQPTVQMSQPGAAPQLRPASSSPQEQPTPASEDEYLEIPAFLRRQAN
jgi:cell division protein FtsZ